MLEIVFTDKKPEAKVVKVLPMAKDKSEKYEFLTTDEGNLLKKAITQSDFEAKSQEVVEVFGGRAKMILLGLGGENNQLEMQNVGKKLYHTLYNDEKAYVATKDYSDAANIAFGILQESYSFDKYKTTKKPEDFTKLEQVVFRVDNPDEAQENFKQYLALATAIRYDKDLCNEPASYLTPEVFAQDVERLRYLGLRVEVLNEKNMQEQGLGLLEAVGKGSNNPPRMVVASWPGNKNSQVYDVAIIGKGICFDAGGLSLKSNAGMVEMKMDMSGAAAAIASLKAAALQRVRKNIVVILGLAENMPSAKAMKIGDVYAAYNGLTVEIMNADAEGRLVVADCLAYLQKNYKVKNIVDITTLGSLRTVLGNTYAGLFANDKSLGDKLLKAAEVAGEKLWLMPLDKEYEKMLSSPIADIRNIAVDGKASIVSAAFLNRFIEKGNKWAHIDMSGVRLDKSGLASGFGVKLLNEFIKGL